MPSRRAAAALCLATLAAAAGCASPAAPYRRAGPPTAFAAAVAPLAVDYVAVSLAASVNRSHATAVDPAAMRRGILDALGGSGIFRSVRPVGEDLALAADPPDEVASRAASRAMQLAARAAGAEVLIQARLVRHDVKYVGRNALFIPSAALWLFCFPVTAPCWWIPDETYRAALAYEVSVLDTRTGVTIASARVEAAPPVRLDDWERGMVFFGIVRVPSALDADNYALIAEHALPFTTAEAERDLCAEVDRAVDPSLRPSPLPRAGGEEPALRPPGAAPASRKR